jgi:hypothetical protein
MYRSANMNGSVVLATTEQTNVHAFKSEMEHHVWHMRYMERIPLPTWPTSVGA